MPDEPVSSVDLQFEGDAPLKVTADKPIVGATIHLSRHRTRGDILAAWRENGTMQKIVKSAQRALAMALYMVSIGEETNGGFLLVQLPSDPEITATIGGGEGMPGVGRKLLETLGIVRQSPLGARYFNVLPSPAFMVDEAQAHLFEARRGAESDADSSDDPRFGASALRRAGADFETASSAPARVGAPLESPPLRSAGAHASGPEEIPVQINPGSGPVRGFARGGNSRRRNFGDVAIEDLMQAPRTLLLAGRIIDAGLLADDDAARLRVFVAAVHAAHAAIEGFGTAQRCRLFCRMVYELAKGEAASSPRWASVTQDEEDRASKALKTARFGDPCRFNLQQPQRPPRPSMSSDAARANAIRDAFTTKGFDGTGMLASDEARKRFQWDRETFLRHLAEADAAIDAWQEAGR